MYIKWWNGAATIKKSVMDSKGKVKVLKAGKGKVSKLQRQLSMEVGKRQNLKSQ